MCLVSNVYRVAGKWIWEVFERKAELGVLFGFFPPFLKKQTNVFLGAFCFSLLRVVSLCLSLPLWT